MEIVVRRRTSTAKKRKPSALEKLQPSEAQEVLHNLLETHPELRKEAEETSRSLISDVSFDDVAGRVELALDHHDLDELNSRSANMRWGYVDPTDAAHEILHKAIDPIIAEMDRQLELGLGRQALETCKGLILGLYDVRDKRDDGCLGWAPDFAWITAEEVLEKWSKGIRGKGKKGSRIRLRSFLDELAPEWSSTFERVLSK